MTRKSDEVPVSYKASSQSHTFHKPTFLYVVAKKNANSKITVLSLAKRKSITKNAPI